jgi:hypothetical protein
MHAQVNEALERAGVKAWVDEQRLDSDLNNEMSDGIDQSKLVLIFVTRAYIEKVQGYGRRGPDEACKAEFEYALRRHGVKRMLAVVMDPECRDTSSWTGAVGFRLGSQIYHDLSGDGVDQERLNGLVAAMGNVGIHTFVKDENRVAEPLSLTLTQAPSSSANMTACASSYAVNGEPQQSLVTAGSGRFLVTAGSGRFLKATHAVSKDMLGGALHNQVLSRVFWHNVPASVVMLFPCFLCVLVHAAFVLLFGEVNTLRQLGFWTLFLGSIYISGACALWISAVSVPSRLLLVPRDATAQLHLASQTTVAEAAMWLCVGMLVSATYSYRCINFFDDWNRAWTVMIVSMIALNGARIGARNFRVQIVKQHCERDGPQRVQVLLSNYSRRVYVVLFVAFFCWLFACSIFADTNTPDSFSEVTLPCTSSNIGMGARRFCDGLSSRFPPLNTSYLDQYCNMSLDDSGSAMWTCDDGGFDSYASRYDACHACLHVPVFDARMAAAGLLALNANYYICWKTWEQTRVEGWRRGGLLAACDALFVGLIWTVSLCLIAVLLVSSGGGAMVDFVSNGQATLMEFSLLVCDVGIHLLPAIRTKIADLVSPGVHSWVTYAPHLPNTPARIPEARYALILRR